MSYQFIMVGCPNVEDNIAIIEDFVKDSSSSMDVKCGSFVTFLNVLRVGPSACKNIRPYQSYLWKIWFQIYRRMMHFSEQRLVIGSFLQDLEHNTKLWLKPSLSAVPVQSTFNLIHHPVEMNGAANISFSKQKYSFIKSADENPVPTHHTGDTEKDATLQCYKNDAAIGGSGDLNVGDNCFRVVSGSNGTTVRVWDYIDGILNSFELQGHTLSVTGVALSSDGRRVICGSDDNNVKVWDIIDGNWNSTELQGHRDCLTSVAICNDGSRVVSGSDDNTVRIWDLNEGDWNSVELERHHDWVTSVAISKDGHRIVSGSQDYTVQVWEYNGRKWNIVELHGHRACVRNVAISADGRRVVSGSEDNTVRVWEYSERNWNSIELKGHNSWVLSVTISKDGHRIVSGSRDNTVRIWENNEENWNTIELQGHRYWVQIVTISNDGHMVFSGSDDSTVRVLSTMKGIGTLSNFKGIVIEYTLLQLSKMKVDMFLVHLMKQFDCGSTMKGAGTVSKFGVIVTP